MPTAHFAQQASQDHPWRRELLLDFENATGQKPADWIIRGNPAAFRLKLSRTNPAPIAGNTNCLCLIYREIPDTSIFFLPWRGIKPLKSDNFISEVKLWVKGNGDRSRLTLILGDMRGRSWQIPFPALEFRGWKLLTIPVKLADGQMDQILGQHSSIFLRGFLVSPQVASRSSQSREICFDQLQFLTRLKWLDVPLGELDQ